MCGLKRDAATNAINALIKAGYCHKRDDRKKGKFSCEYDFYNVPTFESVKKDPVSLSVSDEPSTVQPCREKPSRSTIYKKDKAIKKEAVKTEAEKAEPVRLPHGKHQNVFLTDDEYKTLVETYSKEQTDYSIDTLSDFKKKARHCKYRNDFRTLMDTWIKKDIEWGKIPKPYPIYQTTSQISHNPEVSEKQKQLDELMKAVFAGDYDAIAKGLEEVGF